MNTKHSSVGLHVVSEAFPHKLIRLWGKKRLKHEYLQFSNKYQYTNKEMTKKFLTFFQPGK